MKNIPQIVHERLKAGAAVSGHPDANILTAFGECSLRESERVSVLAHLAACTECREIIALALLATEGTQPASVAARRAWFAWPALRWGFATAGVVVIALGIVEFERRQPVNSTAIVAKQITSAQPMTADLQNQTSSHALSTLPSTASQPEIAPSGAALAKKANPKLTERELRQQRTRKESEPKGPARLQPPSSELMASQQSAKAPAPVPASSRVVAGAQSPSVNVQTSETQVAQAPPGEQFLAYNSGPLSRAKPANTSAAQTNAADAILASPRWSITAAGGLQRSFDQGKTWQDVRVSASPTPAMAGNGMAMTSTVAKQQAVPGAAIETSVKAAATPVVFRAVTAAGNEIWAGGSSASLFHSIDGGDHWTRVLPSSSGTVLTGDVVSVEFSGPQHGTVTTSIPEIWTTSDGGQSWQKQ